jgi:putative glutamine amidotransferase
VARAAPPHSNKKENPAMKTKPAKASQLEFPKFVSMTTRVLMTHGSWTNEIIRVLQAHGARVHVAEDVAQMENLYDRCTHVLIPGGADIHPGFYGEQITYANPCAPDRDWLEFQLVARALSECKPVMGICRGHQLLAVTAGGTLYQDLQRQRKGAHPTTHNAYITPKSQLAKLLGATITVNSYHHQAIKTLPAGFTVAARAHDGTIEAIESPQYPIISVQWHPEVLRDPSSEKLFRAFLNLA